jgi:hypothetical protein
VEGEAIHIQRRVQVLPREGGPGELEQQALPLQGDRAVASFAYASSSPSFPPRIAPPSERRLSNSTSAAGLLFPSSFLPFHHQIRTMS